MEQFGPSTPLPTSLGDWIDTFGNGLRTGLDAPARPAIKADAEAAAAPMHQRRDGTWVLDYVRLRFVAIKLAMSPG